MASNKNLLQKADVALADLASNGGLLLPEQANTFIRKMMIEPTIMKDVRVVTMSAPKRIINKIGFGTRMLRPAVSATPLNVSDRYKFTTEKVQLQTNEMIAEIRLPYDVLEDNIESAATADNGAPNTGPGGLRNTVIEMMGQRAAVDIEEYGLSADTASADPYLAMTDGYLKLALNGGHVVDRLNVPVNKSLFKAGKKAIPKNYLRSLATMKHYVPTDIETDYVDTLADRGTALGDVMLQGKQQAYAYGTPIVSVPMMPSTSGLFVDPKNLILGIQRQISMEYDKDITARVYIIVLTLRVALQIEETDAVVRYANLA